MKTRTILVFPDGETWNTVDGCTIKVLSEDQFIQVCNDEIDAGDIDGLSEIQLGDATP